MTEDTAGETRSLDRFLDSTLDSVDRAESVVLQIARGVGFRQDDLDKIGMAVRESMVNAVTHGNRYSAHKKVHLVVSRGVDHITVTISDEGNGFDLHSLPDPVAEQNLLRQSGRGILLIRSFMDEFQMRRLTPVGTEVKLVKRIIHE